MRTPAEIEWSTENIRVCDADRADSLESCGSYEELISELCRGVGVRCEGEGLRAPLPLSEDSWLELKGGFFGADGASMQIKPQYERAVQISEYGWTWRS